MTKNYNSSKSNTSSVRGEDGLTPDGGGGGEDPMTKNYNSSKSNTSSVSEAPVGDGGGPGEPAGDVRSQGEWGDINQDSKTNAIGYQGHLVDNTGTQSVRGEDGLTPDGGGSTSAAHEAAHVVQQRGGDGGIKVIEFKLSGGDGNGFDIDKYEDDVVIKNPGLTPDGSGGSNVPIKSGDGGGGNGGKAGVSVADSYEVSVDGSGGGGGGSEKSGSAGRGERRKEMRKKFDKGSAGPDHDHNDIGGATRISNQGRSSSGAGPPDPARGTNHNSTKSNTTSVKKGPGIVRKGVGKTLGLAKSMIMTAVLISVAGAGVDVYQTYNDAIAIDLEEHITDADFEMSDDKSEISGSVGFDIPQMGTFEKSIIASVHITVLESNPTTDGDYEFEYTLGSGEHFYDFTLDDLDPVTVEKIEAGQPLDIEYSGTISVTYLGIEIPSVTMDIPLTTTIVETA